MQWLSHFHSLEKKFFWICLESFATMDGCNNWSDIVFLLDGFKNCKDAKFKTRFDLNNRPQLLLDWHENDKNDKTLVIVFKKP